jgi:hypothetical protein
MRQLVRRGIVVMGLVLALAPLSAFADQLSNDANQEAIDAAKAQKAWLQNMNPMQQGVELGQMEIANARAMAKFVPWNGHAQSEIPNSMQQYSQYCDMVIQNVAAKVANATEMVAMRPWDTHAQAELANATAISRAVWSIIGDSYPGNPYKNLSAPPALPVYADVPDDAAMAGDEDVMADDAALVADDAALVAADPGVVDDAIVADTALDAVD